MRPRSIRAFQKTPADSTTFGLPLRSGRKVGPAPHIANRWATEIYPLIWPPLTSLQPFTLLTQPMDLYAQELELDRGALKGFAACQSGGDVAGFSLLRLDPQWNGKRYVFTVDEHIVRERGGRNPRALSPTFVQERDTAVFVKFDIGL